MPNSRNRKMMKKRNSMNKKGKIMGKQWKGGGDLTKRLICISDLEGCQGSPLLCKTDTFNIINNILKPKLLFDDHVVFLGDYFDQGAHMIESINGIGMLIDEYIIEKENPKVHIILGNRDINKFRILYETLHSIPIENIEKIWPVWKGANLNEEITTNTDKVKKITRILQTTFGNGNFGIKTLIQNIQIECQEYNNIEKITTKEITELDGLYIICKIFAEDAYLLNTSSKLQCFTEAELNMELINSDYVETFCKNARKLFYYGRLMSAFNIENNAEKKYVLMSHAGGYNKFIFNLNQALYDTIPISDTKLEQYYQYMEDYRKMFLDNNTIFTKENNSKTIPEFMNDTTGINSVYVEFITKIINADGTLTGTNLSDLIDSGDLLFRKNYFILQALGLKPNTPNIKETGFVSPIESCSFNGGCGDGVKPPNDEIVQQFSNFGIKYVVNGHIPHCTTVPLIYQRNIEGTNTRVVFVNNDTSNGYTPDKYQNVSEIPLSFLTANQVGIGSLLKKNETLASLNLSANRIKGYIIDLPDKEPEKEPYSTPYTQLIKIWSYTETPKIISNGADKYTLQDDKFTLEIKGARAPLEIQQRGGRKRCSKKMIRKCKRMTKKTISKMGCGRCC